MMRTPRPTDQPYIASSWIRSLVGAKRMGPRYGHVGTDVDAVLDRSDTRAIVRHAAHDQDVILGYVIYAEGVGVPLVHYVYTRNRTDTLGTLRQKGIAHAMLEAIGVTRDGPVVCTSLGPDSRLLRAAYPASVYMPLKEFLG